MKKKKVSKLANNWSVSGVWNDLLVAERKPAARAYIRASEIGSPFLDRYLKMKGKKYTNPYTARVLRVFDTGHIFEKDVVERIFKLLGLWISTQKELIIEKEGLLPVVGHHDPKVGGKIKYWQTMKRIKWRSVSPWMRVRVLTLMQILRKKYPNGLKKLITEIKTVNSMAFWAPRNQDSKTHFFKGYPHHKLQLWTYLQRGRENEGRLFYLSKDDLTLQETPVFKDDKELERLWINDVAEMTRIWKSKKEPPHEPYIVFNEDKQIFEFNWRIKRSNYFTYITGFNDIKVWEKKYYPELKVQNSKPCKKCNIIFQLQTLNKNQGYCGRCITALGIKKNGGENNNG